MLRCLALHKEQCPDNFEVLCELQVAVLRFLSIRIAVLPTVREDGADNALVLRTVLRAPQIHRRLRHEAPCSSAWRAAYVETGGRCSDPVALSTFSSLIGAPWQSSELGRDF